MESLDPDAILAAMKAGHYYASTGATIRNVEITDTEIIVETDPAIGIMLGGAGTVRQYVRGDGPDPCRVHPVAVPAGVLPGDRDPGEWEESVVEPNLAGRGG